MLKSLEQQYQERCANQRPEASVASGTLSLRLANGSLFLNLVSSHGGVATAAYEVANGRLITTGSNGAIVVSTTEEQARSQLREAMESILPAADVPNAPPLSLSGEGFGRGSDTVDRELISDSPVGDFLNVIRRAVASILADEPSTATLARPPLKTGRDGLPIPL